MEKFSIIIPTMWKSPLIHQLIRQCHVCPFIEEIIIINNDVQHTPKNLFVSDKIRKFQENTNRFVNASWNIGAKYANHTIILANDDILIDNMAFLFENIVSQQRFDLIGATINNLSAQMNPVQRWAKTKGFPRKSFGCFMVCRKYVPIPEEMKILCGDNWLFDHADTVGIIGAGYIYTPISVTIKSDPAFNEIGKRDKEIYKQLIQTIKN